MKEENATIAAKDDVTTAALLAEVGLALRVYRFNTSSEALLQEAIHRALVEQQLEHEREVRLSQTDRIDFLTAAGVGLEVKIDGSHNDVMRQLSRYAAHECIRALLLVTTKSKHINMPRKLQGKLVGVHFIGGVR